MSQKRSSAPKLTPLAARFAEEYLLDLNGARAYLRANPRVSYDAAVTNASRMLANAKVREEIERLMQQRSTQAAITAADVLARFWAIATADPRELISVHVFACPFCWRPAGSKLRSVDNNSAEEAPRSMLDVRGGTPQCADGHRGTKHPDPQCTECFGDGRPKVIAKDTRSLSKQAALLYAGARSTRHGVEYILNDQSQALLKVGQHLGLWSGKTIRDGEDSLSALLRQIQENGSSLKAVRTPPE